MRLDIPKPWNIEHLFLFSAVSELRSAIRLVTFLFSKGCPTTRARHRNLDAPLSRRTNRSKICVLVIRRPFGDNSDSYRSKAPHWKAWNSSRPHKMSLAMENRPFMDLSCSSLFTSWVSNNPEFDPPNHYWRTMLGKQAQFGTPTFDCWMLDLHRITVASRDWFLFVQLRLYGIKSTRDPHHCRPFRWCPASQWLLVCHPEPQAGTVSGIRKGLQGCAHIQTRARTNNGAVDRRLVPLALQSGLRLVLHQNLPLLEEEAIFALEDAVFSDELQIGSRGWWRPTEHVLESQLHANPHSRIKWHPLSVSRLWLSVWTT